MRTKLTNKHLPTHYPKQAIDGDHMPVRMYYAHLGGVMTVHEKKRTVVINLQDMEVAQ